MAAQVQEAGAPAGSAAGKNAASDEELARRLHAQLNGEALALAVRRRTRKQPSFYTPQVLT
jgi:hypothetical protein